MPELSRFYGIIIRMYMEVDEPHHLPHFQMRITRTMWRYLESIPLT